MGAHRKCWQIRFAAGEPDWHMIPVLEADQVLWLPDCGIRAFGQFTYSPSALHVRLCAAEKQIRAEYTAPLSPVHQDSCLEFFFMPEGEDRYFNFEINPNGCLHTGFGPNRQNRAVLFPGDPDLFRIRTERTAGGWEAAYRIPLSFLQLFLPGFTFTGNLRANVYKCGDLTEQEHYLAWNPVTSDAPDFHRPADFGVMKFEQEESSF